MVIKVYQPDVQVWLHKTVKRETTNGSNAVSARFSGKIGEQKIDLRPYLGEGAGVSTAKAMGQPAGAFRVVLVDKPSGNEKSFESLYGLIEPMDMVEIRMRHDVPSDWSASKKAPIIMRGFVTDVAREEAIGGDGKPQRQVVISGQDYGKIWQIIRVSYHAAYLLGKRLLTSFKLFEMYGNEGKNTMTAGAFFKEVVNTILTPYLQDLMPKNSPPEMPNAITAESSVTGGAVSLAVQSQQGTIYELLKYFGDVGPWNEMFIEDRENGVYAVYRPNPYLKAGTPSPALIQQDAPPPEYVDVLDEDVVSLSLSRSDENLANFYWVEGVRFNLNQAVAQRQEAASSGDPTAVLSDYPNSKMGLYGIRLMMLQSNQGPAGLQSFDSGAKEADYLKAQANSATWLTERRRIVSESNKDNVVFERGTMRIRGNEKVMAGKYIRLHRGSTTAIYYVTQVNHDYQPFGSGFMTTAIVERGTGFIERISNKGSPYMQELTSIK